MMRRMISLRIICLVILVSATAALAQLPGAKKDKPTAAVAPRNAIRGGPYLELGPLLGDVTSTSAKVWLKASGAGLLSVAVGRKEDLSDREGFKASKLEAASFFSTSVRLKDLEPATKYFYAVLVDGELVTPRPYPSFTTAPREGASGRQRFAFVSCVGHQGFDSAAAWADLATRTSFDVLLMLGDNHYGDTTNPEKHLAMLGAQRRLPGYAEISRRVPQYAIWDNHDYTPAPTDKRATGKAESLRAFQMLWPNPAFGEADNPGVYFKFTRGDIDFFMLDGRYHRDPDNAPDDGTKTHLGEKQLAWLKRELLASKAKVKVLATGGEWQTHSQAASWTSFARERADLFKFIDDNKIAGLLLLSGDRHFTAAYQAAGKFIEVTSGPMGSKNVDPKPTPEMWWNGGKTGKFYCVFDVDTAPEKPRVTLEIYRASEGLALRRELTWEEVLGETKIKPLPRASIGN
jgi:alkaline phosphatase D